MGQNIGQNRVFLFLQGPHGPFFAQLGDLLTATGARCLRVGFNAGDAAFRSRAHPFIPHATGPEDWPDHLARLIATHGVSDIVLYGDTRPVHAAAVRQARAAGITTHVFEEGYLRPHWVTYERDGANGHSRLVDLSLDEMRDQLARLDLDLPDAPARWGDLRQHVVYGALYHFRVLVGNAAYPGYKPHRDLSVGREFRLYLKRLLQLPVHALQRRIATRRIRFGGFPYHLVLLQLEHDASFQQHSPFSTMAEFLEVCIAGFAKGAHAHHHLVFKSHPLEDGRVPVRDVILRLARAHGVAGRIHFVRGGKLAELLDHTRSVVTVNSTAAQQALWRGLPVRAFGQAVYAKPDFVSDQPLDAFFADPARPDTRAYRVFRHYLLETSQVMGGFYARRARQRLLRQVVDMILSAQDPYDALRLGTAPPRQHLRVVR